MINEAVMPIWNKTPETARRVRGRIERIVQWMKDGKPLPGAGKNGKRSHPALPWQEVPQFMAELRQRQGASARALEFTILTAARTGETHGKTCIPVTHWYSPTQQPTARGAAKMTGR